MVSKSLNGYRDQLRVSTGNFDNLKATLAQNPEKKAVILMTSKFLCKFLFTSQDHPGMQYPRCNAPHGPNPVQFRIPALMTIIACQIISPQFRRAWDRQRRSLAELRPFWCNI